MVCTGAAVDEMQITCVRAMFCERCQNVEVQDGSQLGKPGQVAQSQGIHLRRAANGGNAQVAHVPVSIKCQGTY
jgi:hypothetical protein